MRKIQIITKQIGAVFSVTILLFIGSCSITSLPSDVNKSVNNTESSIQDASNKLNKAQTVTHNKFIAHTNTGYFGSQAIVQNDTDFLPPVFSEHIQIDKQFYGIRSIATGITDLIRVPTLLDMTTVDVTSTDSCSEVRITQQDGNLIDLLNLIAARCDVGWAYREGKIILSDTETKTWSIKNIPGEIQVQNQINNNAGVQSQSGATGQSIGGGSGGGGGSTGQSQAQSQQNAIQNIAFNLQNSLWTNLQDAVKSMLSKSGKLSISPATSSLTVTDRPSVLLRVDRYMKNQNDIMKRQVQIDVQVLNVDVDATDNYGINWALALQGTNAGFSVNGQAISPGNVGSQFVPSPVFVPSNTTQAFTLSANSGDLNSSQLIINALSSITKTSLVTTAAVTTLSNQPVPVQFVDQLSYLASVTTTQVAQVGSQTALTPGQLTTGFSLNVLPVIQSDGNVFLQLSLNISALKKISQYSTEGASVQLPETIQRNLMQKAVIHSGDTFVVTGFDSDASAITNSGVGGTSNWLFGGGVTANKIRTKMVILVTPRVVSS